MKKCPVSTFLKLESISIIGGSLSENTLIFNASIFPNLKFVNLLNNKFKQIPIIESIGGTQFHALNLTYIILSQNEIVSLKNIDRLRKLGTLSLHFNKITSWNSSDVFQSERHNIINVQLQNNLISKLTPVMRDSLTVDSNVNIENNPFDCDDCSIPDFQAWIRENKQNYDFLLCATPTSVRETPILQVNFDIEKCLPPKDYMWLVYLFFSLLMTLTVALSVFVYINRFRITYMFHLIHKGRKIINNDQEDGIWKYDALVSYSYNDEEWVKTFLLAKLENREKYKLCLQERDFKIGAFIFENIMENILCSRHAILVISPNFVANNMCQWELKLIQRSFDLSPSFLILIELERLTHKELPTNLRLLMGTRTYLEWTTQNESRFWERLKLALGTPLRSSQSEPTQKFPREQQNGPTEEEVV
ncbi:hypothetical protein B566_EDAN002038 [Ephemera danica]|nr:hypothetical protein B566_EDAN002038 [Ephemera danica]